MKRQAFGNILSFLQVKSQNPSGVERSPSPASVSELLRGGKQSGSVAVSTHIYSEKNEAERDWNGVKYKYDPAWDDGSAFPFE